MKKKNSRMGRPPVSDPACRVWGIVFTTAALDKLNALAEAAGESKSAVVRRLVLDATK